MSLVTSVACGSVLNLHQPHQLLEVRVDWNQLWDSFRNRWAQRWWETRCPVPGKPLTWGTGVGNNEAVVTLYLWAGSVDMAVADSVDIAGADRVDMAGTYNVDMTRAGSVDMVEAGSVDMVEAGSVDNTRTHSGHVQNRQCRLDWSWTLSGSGQSTTFLFIRVPPDGMALFPAIPASICFETSQGSVQNLAPGGQEALYLHLQSPAPPWQPGGDSRMWPLACDTQGCALRFFLGT